MDFTEEHEAHNHALRVAADEIREAIDELAGMEVEESDDDPKPDFLPDDVLRAATAIADHLDPSTTGDSSLVEKLKAAIAVTATPRRHS
jgi:hypothetical protein